MGMGNMYQFNNFNNPHLPQQTSNNFNVPNTYMPQQVTNSEYEMNQIIQNAMLQQIANNENQIDKYNAMNNINIRPQFVANNVNQMNNSYINSYMNPVKNYYDVNNNNY